MPPTIILYFWNPQALIKKMHQMSLYMTYPAKSTKCNLDLFTVADSGCVTEICMVKIQCDRVDAWFIGVYKNNHV